MRLRYKEVGLATWPNHFLILVMSPTPASTYIENNDLTTTVAASENSDVFQQQAAASGSPQQVPASVASTRKLVRGNESISRVDGTLSRGNRKQKAELAV